MAVETADGGALDTQRPLTPPADFMDLDIDSHGRSLANGHHFKDSSPNTAPLTGNSTQATSIDDVESTEINGVDALAVKSNEIASKLNSHYSATDGADAPSIAPADQSYDHTLDPPKEGADEPVLNSTSSLPQQPSDLRDEPQSAGLEQASEHKEQKQQEDIARDPELANDLLSDHSQVTRLPASADSQAPAASTSQVKSEFISPDQDLEPNSAAPGSSIATAEVPHHPPVPIPEGMLPEEPLDPAPSPAQPTAETDQFPDRGQMSPEPEPPFDPQSPSKVSRPREEDQDEAPVAKRPKVEPETPPANEESTNADFKVPAAPGQLSITDDSAATLGPSEPAKPITAAQKKHMIRAIQNIKRTNDGKPFAAPVDIVALNIPNYPDLVKHPMDLRTMEEKLKGDLYPSVEAVKADFALIVSNTVAFNGAGHFVSKHGYAMAKMFERVMANLPSAEVGEPTRADKKSKKTSLPLADKVGPPKRESRASLPAATAPSPISAQSPTTPFALNPLGVPLIRRDSTKGDGRPKREIHPPAPRDLPYAASKPKKKKYQAELKFCMHVLNELAKPRYAVLTAPFATPVDPVALNIPDYHKVIKKPMDLGTVREKLEKGQYENAKEFDADVKLVFKNARTYNPPDNPIHKQATQLEDHYKLEMDHKRAWIDTNSPVSGPQSTTSSDVEDEEMEDDEDDGEDDADEDQLTKLQRSIALMSQQVKMLQQKKKSPPAAGKKASKGAKPDKKAVKKVASEKPAKQEKKAPAKHKKEQYVTYEQKQDISNRINSLSEAKMAKALKIIRDNMPGLKGVQDDELELDIDELSDDVLRKLHDFVRRNSKGEVEAPRPPPVASTAPAPTRKKNKPMSKQEQERQIQDLKNLSSQFQNPTPSIENAPDAYAVHNDTSGDEDDSEESEEE